MDESTLSCAVTLEWANSQGVVMRKEAHKVASLKLIRSEVRNMFVEVSVPKSSPTKLELIGISVHNKFMSEGKASILFGPIRCTLFLSNAPPGQLFAFLRTIFIKMTGQKTPTTKNGDNLRSQVLRNLPRQFDEISPITEAEVNKAKTKITKTSDTTPSPGSRKRKLSAKPTGATAPKRLYTSSPTLNEPLDIEQKEVLDACTSGSNVFFTGSAGTGKSYLLKKIIAALPPDVTIATASTGVAACQIGGITLHQFAGIGSGDYSFERSVQLASKTQAATTWRKCKHLIIDEISMVDGDFFEKIEKVARHIRRNEKPFGGIQLIISGDFFQLPPVNKNKNNAKTFCFQTAAWEKCNLVCYELKRVHRQNDNEFISILNDIRKGRVTDETTKKLVATELQTIEKNGILATRLCSHTQDANTINESKLEALEGTKQIYTAEDSHPNMSQQMNQLVVAPSRLEIKIGAQVMLLKNISIASGLVNGARGVVKCFKEGLPLVQFRGKEYLVKHERWMVKTANGGALARKQIPLKLAWAFSIHKSQGLTLDCVEMSLGKVFESGQAYVALSRAQSLETVRILDFKATQVWANPEVLKFYKNLNLQMEGARLIPLGRKNSENKNKTVRKILKTMSNRAITKPLVTIN